MREIWRTDVTEERMRGVIDMGFQRVLLILSRRGRDEDWATLERYAKLIRAFQ